VTFISFLSETTAGVSEGNGNITVDGRR